jgi:alkanesulfonate monooxygenase SsuD/methylene tetrahydromethanopterin reductase-like flavin-dependent oxidoreductase (luciferase family)
MQTFPLVMTEPFNLARQFASLDHISNGRVGWNIVTSWLATAAGNFGDAGQVSHADRYARGEEFMTVVKALWDSWAEDAVIDDRDGGRYAKPDRIRPINHKGEHYQVAGPLNMPRCPQGRPVLVQAGSSDTGRRFAARHAEAVFTAHMEKATAQAFYADLKALVAAEGRAPEQVLILPGLSPMIASTEAEAQRLARETNELSDPEVGRKRLSGRFGGHDFSHLPLDRPLVPEDFPAPSSVEAARSRTEVILGLVRRESCTGDRRGQFAVLTDFGWETIQRVAPSHVEHVRKSFIEQKPIAKIDDETLIMADVSRKAIAQVKVAAQELLERHLAAEAAGALAEKLSTGIWTHDYPISPDEAKRLGLNVSTELPEEVLQLMTLYPQPVRMQAGSGVEYLPVPRRRKEPQR